MIRCAIQSLKYMLDGDRDEPHMCLCQVVLIVVNFILVKTQDNISTNNGSLIAALLIDEQLSKYLSFECALTT